MRLDAGYARQVAILHHQGGFARGWEPAECAALIADAGVAADGVFGRSSDPAGFVMSRKAADEAEILSIVVSPASRRDGLGRALLSAHLARLAEDGVAHVFLEVEEGNLAAERLYRHFGFREVGRRKGYYPKADGSRATAIAMRLDLT
ncbi:GNAT family N-acetyltransferase [Bosea sp. RAF48]|uniref:GNAT family N-acetyltransferase n=1 Tax=Bosea sp. RAF48 TaxID=3237480 RepID=UPI003F92D1C3